MKLERHLVSSAELGAERICLQIVMWWERWFPFKWISRLSVILLSAFGALQILDVSTTIMFVRDEGIRAEGNLFGRQIFSLFNEAGFWLTKLFIVCAMLLALLFGLLLARKRPDETKLHLIPITVIIVCLILNLYYINLVLHNFVFGILANK